jgi:hypothetical protein
MAGRKVVRNAKWREEKLAKWREVQTTRRTGPRIHPSIARPPADNMAQHQPSTPWTMHGPAWTMDINLTRNRPANNNNYEDYLPNNNHKVLNLYYSQHHHHYYCYLRLAN